MKSFSCANLTNNRPYSLINDDDDFKDFIKYSAMSLDIPNESSMRIQGSYFQPLKRGFDDEILPCSQPAGYLLATELSSIIIIVLNRQEFAKYSDFASPIKSTLPSIQGFFMHQDVSQRVVIPIN